MKPERLAAMRLFAQVKPCGDHARDVLMLEVIAPMLAEALAEIERQAAAIRAMTQRINVQRDAALSRFVWPEAEAEIEAEAEERTA